ncbi:hypothetical protein [Companilactobacillus mishanensis]|uniref:DUF443 family protein n=1 Tax=Companilactobacillus mishanensis TaxID=2486008 RepID=A0A5P0ZKI0_9LACO|nr:hypothetical protein [Companilactobacillus mishanensis]MQS53552.1 hypothetical protein [Companilactobacillus mishanensis]
MFSIFRHFQFVDDDINNFRYIYDGRTKRLLVYNLPSGPTKMTTSLINGIWFIAAIAVGGAPGIPLLLEDTQALDMKYRYTIFISSILIGVLLIPTFQVWFQSGFERGGRVLNAVPDEKDVLYSIDNFREQYQTKLHGSTKRQFMINFYKEFALKAEIPIIIVILACINMIFYLSSIGSVFIVALCLIVTLSLGTWTLIMHVLKVKLIAKILFSKTDNK